MQYRTVQYNDTFFLKMLYPQFPSSFIYESHLWFPSSFIASIHFQRVAKNVLRRGANINSRNAKGNTPLHYCFHCKLKKKVEKWWKIYNKINWLVVSCMGLVWYALCLYWKSTSRVITRNRALQGCSQYVWSMTIMLLLGHQIYTCIFALNLRKNGI